MCGRFTLKTPAPVLIEHFQLDGVPTDELPLFKPRYNIAPTQDVAAVRTGDQASERQACELRWGLIPSWAKDPTIGSRMINARGETVAEKPSFRNAFRRRRCLIVADGFYEWKKQGKSKQPYYIHQKDDEPFAFAGLWERWRPGDDGGGIETCTIITTQANQFMADLHERMPVILSPGDYEHWLDVEGADAESVLDLIRPLEPDVLRATAVSTHVNKPATTIRNVLRPWERQRMSDRGRSPGPPKVTVRNF